MMMVPLSCLIKPEGGHWNFVMTNVSKKKICKMSAYLFFGCQYIFLYLNYAKNLLKTIIRLYFIRCIYIYWLAKSR